MAEIVKFMYIMIIFIFIFLVSIKVEGKPFFYLFKFLYFSLHDNLSHSNNNFLFSFFVTTGRVWCILDEDCREYTCTIPLKARCIRPRFFFRGKDGFCICE